VTFRRALGLLFICTSYAISAAFMAFAQSSGPHAVVVAAGPLLAPWLLWCLVSASIGATVVRGLHVSARPLTGETRLLARAVGFELLVAPLVWLCTEWSRLAAKYAWTDTRGAAGMSVLIACYATALLIVALQRASRPARNVALGLFGILILKMFLVDLAELETIWRVVAFIAVGALLLAAWSLLRERMPAGEESSTKPPPV